MFRDTQEELDRLEAELLAEDEDTAAEPDAPDFSEFDQDVFDGDEPTMIYPGGADRFRREMDDYRQREKSAPPVQARNTDLTDGDLEEYSEQVWDPDGGKDHAVTCLAVLAVVLTLAIVAVVLWWVLRYTEFGA